MKKLFFLLPLAAFMFASCSSDNDEQIVNTQEAQFQKVPEGAIWFTSGIQELTRATTTMDDFAEFKVWGIHTTNGFENLLVTKSGSVWTYPTGDDAENPVYKTWPNDNSSVDFFAFAPSSGTNDLTSKMAISSTSQVMTGFTQNQIVAQHVDVLAAYATGNKSSNLTSGVMIDFKHALSQIEILAKNSAASEYKVKVLGVKVCRVNNTGNMAFQTAVNGYPVWSSQSGSNSYIVEGAAADAIDLSAEAQSIMFGTDNFLMVPQQLTAWSGSDQDIEGSYISVLCQIYKKNGENWEQKFPDTADKYSFTSIPVGTKWEPGHKYVYTLDFFGAGAGAGQFDPDPQNPEKPSDPDDPNYDPDNQDPNIDPTPGGDNPEDQPSGGDPIIPEAKAPIKFTVNITDWVSGEGDSEVLNL